MMLTVRGSSMAGLFSPGDEVEIEQGAALGAGDAVAYNDGRGISLKRLVGAPGDSVAVHGGLLLINGLPIATSSGELLRLDERQALLWADWAAEFGGRVPAHGYIMAGNVQHSIDSRSRGYVWESQILGRVVSAKTDYTNY